MPIVIIRPSAIPSAPALGATITTTVVNGLNSAAKWITQGGYQALSLQSGRMNGRLHPRPGVSGGVVFQLDNYVVDSRVFVPNGYNYFHLQATFKLNALGVASGTIYGAVLTLELLKGGSATPIQTIRYDDTDIAIAGGVGYRTIVDKLPFKALGSPRNIEELYLRVSVDLCDGNRTLDGVQVTPAQAVGFYQGIEALQLHLFRNTDINF